MTTCTFKTIDGRTLGTCDRIPLELAYLEPVTIETAKNEMILTYDIRNTWFDYETARTWSIDQLKAEYISLLMNGKTGDTFPDWLEMATGKNGALFDSFPAVSEIIANA